MGSEFCESAFDYNLSLNHVPWVRLQVRQERKLGGSPRRLPACRANVNGPRSFQTLHNLEIKERHGRRVVVILRVPALCVRATVLNIRNRIALAVRFV